MGRFDGKVALVTGAASGLGRATAACLGADGARVFGLDLNAEGLAETGAGLTGYGSRVVDISSREECHGAVAACVEEMGRLDVLCNVAGVLRTGRVTEVTEADWDLVFGVNVAGMFWMCQAAIPHLIESQGNIVNVASNAGLMGTAYTTVYAASKGAVVNLTRSLAMEYVKEPIRINAVAPGGIKTPMAKATVLPDDADWDLIKPYMGWRPMSPASDIAAVIAFVASPDAAAVHGSIISADSGLTAG